MDLSPTQLSFDSVLAQMQKSARDSQEFWRQLSENLTELDQRASKDHQEWLEARKVERSETSAALATLAAEFAVLRQDHKTLVRDLRKLGGRVGVAEMYLS
jgi:hypothetical protein